ncbi:MAG TPA: hypothetical protein VFW98_05520 [Gemmatimonadaceae bacterium]|nr:hypothetical protein [Gemmatimonadaceae bacterium]
MVLGHYAVALAAKRAAPRTSLGTPILAAQWLDELWPIPLLLGVEHVRIVPGLMAASPLDVVSYPVTHSLLAAVVLILVFVSGFAGPPPPNEQALAVTTLALWVFVPWGYWVDRHREVRGDTVATSERASVHPGRPAKSEGP